MCNKMGSCDLHSTFVSILVILLILFFSFLNNIFFSERNGGID